VSQGKQYLNINHLFAEVRASGFGSLLYPPALEINYRGEPSASVVTAVGGQECTCSILSDQCLIWRGGILSLKQLKCQQDQSPIC